MSAFDSNYLIRRADLKGISLKSMVCHYPPYQSIRASNLSQENTLHNGMFVGGKNYDAVQNSQLFGIYRNIEVLKDY